MVKSLAVMTNRSKEIMSEYTEEVNQMSLEELVAEFLSYLDYTEESDSGNVFHPITIGCCRILMSKPLDFVINSLRKRVDGYGSS